MTDAFAELVMPIFRKGIELQDRLSREESLTLAQVKQMARGWIEDARRRASGSAGLGRSLELALFGLVAWIDESLYESEWGGRLSPEENILEWDLFGTRLRAGRYYREARKAERNHDLDALEVYLLGMTLGFRGLPPVDFENRDQLRDDADEVRYRGAAEVDYDVRLAGWVDGLYQLVSGAGGVPDRPFAEDPPRHDQFAPLHGPSLLLTVSILVSITALITLAIYLLTVQVDYNANHPGSSSVGRAGPRPEAQATIRIASGSIRTGPRRVGPERSGRS
jgi:hypothetical protein